MIQKFTKIIGLVALTSMSTLLEAQMKWSPAGPVYTAGRARNMVVDKTDASGNTLYVGSTTSGVFKSTDGGYNWAPIDDQGTVRNISYMAQGGDGTIFVGTGEGFLRTGQRAKSLPGTGLYKLNGNNLVQLVGAAAVGTVINRVAVSGNNIALATNLGIMLSSDGGSSFALAPSIPTSSLTSGMDVKFDSNGLLYCTVGSIAGTSTLIPAGKIYKSSTNALSSFQDITPTNAQLPNLDFGRIELAIAPTNANVIYASCANKNTTGASASSATLKGLLVSYNAGITWAIIALGSPQLDPLSNGGTLASGDYAHVLLVSPTDQHTLFFGGYFMKVWKRDVGSFGDSDATPKGDWGQLGSPFVSGFPLYLHENIHDIRIIPSTPNNKYFFVTDAGIYRCTDLVSMTQNVPPSFQPFYKGLVTGQFNSVSIERYPTGEGIGSTTPGSTITPYSGFIGGTGGNGVTYYSGTFSLVTQESSYRTGDFYNVEYSKILPDAAFASSGDGSIFRTANIKTSSPIPYSVNRYTGGISRLSPEPATFINQQINTGTPFKLWEYYGQIPSNPDQAIFYNDSIPGFSGAGSSTLELSTNKTFTVDITRPFRGAKIDSVVVRTGTVVLAQIPNAPAFTTSKTMWIKVKQGFANTNSVTTITGTNIAQFIGDVGVDQPTITLNNSNLNDRIVVPFPLPPFGDKTATATNPNHYRVFVTVFYRFDVGDSVAIEDKNISTFNLVYSGKFTQPASWQYGTAPAFTVNVPNSPAVSNPTYVLLPGNTTFTNATTFTSLPVTANVIGVRSVSVTQLGTYTMSAKPVDYTLSVLTDTNITGPTYTFNIQPGTATQTAALSSTVPVKFVVTPSVTTVYTITQTGSSTLTSVNVFTVNASSYSINPGNVTQSSPVFTVVISALQAPSAFTLTGISSDLLIGNNTNSLSANFPIRTVANVGSSTIPVSQNNPLVKVPMRFSARLAVAVKNGELTGGQDAIAVSRNPLALNDPGNFVRVSQSGCLTDDANGNPTNNTIVIDGRPTILEWSKSGTEIYYATDANKVYRVSHITDIYDLSKASGGTRFHTDVFNYNASSPHTPNSGSINTKSPYRTTLIGSFDRPITSISVAGDDSKLVLTFNNPAQTGTTGIVMYSGTANVKTSNAINWVKADNGLAGKLTYCSMIEKDDIKRVFVGTNEGLVMCTDITAALPAFTNVNDNLATQDKIPNVQVFDIKQQTIAPWDCYNSGQIYVATNGRGVWTNTSYLKNFAVNIQESKYSFSDTESLHIFPNPTNSDVNVSFEGFGAQKVRIALMDISGRQISSETIEISGDDQIHSLQTASLTAGIYLITVAGENGTNKTGKLVVTK